jgi:hypothetical protein
LSFEEPLTQAVREVWGDKRDCREVGPVTLLGNAVEFWGFITSRLLVGDMRSAKLGLAGLDFGIDELPFCALHL